MRPVEKGDWPKEHDRKISFSDYQKARGELIKRLGEYCSYCEMELDTALAVEHVQPKRPSDHTVDIDSRKTDWANFLLACTNCNSTKGNQEVIIANYYWPHLDNTFRAIEYTKGGLVRPRSENDIDQTKALATIKLVGLDVVPKKDPKAKDRRWNNRREAWDLAQDSRDDLRGNDCNAMRRQIVRTAVAKGYWSIWMTVFRHDPDMLSRFISSFKGTSTSCFDSRGQTTVRVGGAC